MYVGEDSNLILFQINNMCISNLMNKQLYPNNSCYLLCNT